MPSRCWEWVWRYGQHGAFQLGAGDSRDDSLSGQRAALILAGRTLQSGDYVGAVCGKQRILDYNEDDCVATRVLLDGIRELS